MTGATVVQGANFGVPRYHLAFVCTWHNETHVERVLHTYLPSYNSRYHTAMAHSIMDAPSPALEDLLAIPSAPPERVFVPPTTPRGYGTRRNCCRRVTGISPFHEGPLSGRD